MLPALHVVQYEHVPGLRRERGDRPLEVQRLAGPGGGHRPRERLQVVGQSDTRFPTPPLTPLGEDDVDRQARELRGESALSPEGGELLPRADEDVLG